MYSCPLLSEKIAVHGLLRLLNGHVVIELTSVKKGLPTNVKEGEGASQ